MATSYPNTLAGAFQAISDQTVSIQAALNNRVRKPATAPTENQMLVLQPDGTVVTEDIPVSTTNSDGSVQTGTIDDTAWQAAFK